MKLHRVVLDVFMLETFEQWIPTLAAPNCQDRGRRTASVVGGSRKQAFYKTGN
jgi:hypothetical protein